MTTPVTESELNTVFEAMVKSSSPDASQLDVLSEEALNSLVKQFGGEKHLLKNTVDRMTVSSIAAGIKAGLMIAELRANIGGASQGS